MHEDKLIISAQISRYDNSVNNGFAKVKILVDTYEQVANGTRFSKELLLSKMSKLNYLPIVAEFKEDNNDFGGHGGKIELSDEGIEWIDTTKPYGVVIENSGRFEEVVKPNGDSITYVVCDGYVWVDRYPELNILFEGKPNNQSMEIKVISGHYGDDDVYYIDDFEYSALCILGKSVIPAFDLAKIEAKFESNDFKSQYTEMLNALEKYLSDDSPEEDSADSQQETDDKEDEFGGNEEESKAETEAEEESEENQTEENMEDDSIEEEVNYQELYESTLAELNNIQNNLNDLQNEFNTISTEFEEYKNNYSTPNSEVTELKEFKSTKLAEERAFAEESLFEQFSELDGNAEFEALKSNSSKYEITELEKECYVILGKKNAKFSSNKPNKNNKVKITFTKSEDNSGGEYDELFDKYLKGGK